MFLLTFLVKINQLKCTWVGSKHTGMHFCCSWLFMGWPASLFSWLHWPFPQGTIMFYIWTYLAWGCWQSKCRHHSAFELLSFWCGRVFPKLILQQICTIHSLSKGWAPVLTLQLLQRRILLLRLQLWTWLVPSLLTLNRYWDDYSSECD